MPPVCCDVVPVNSGGRADWRAFDAHAGIGGYSTSIVGSLFLAALTVVLATAPRPGEDPYATPAGERPLPWDYDAQEVANYWAQRWAAQQPILPIP